jgi:hypothetical protein
VTPLLLRRGTRPAEHEDRSSGRRLPLKTWLLTSKEKVINTTITAEWRIA